MPRIHDLEQLMALIEEGGGEVPESLRPVVELTDFATQFRYEPYADLNKELDRHRVTQQIQALLQHVGALFARQND